MPSNQIAQFSNSTHIIGQLEVAQKRSSKGWATLNTREEMVVNCRARAVTIATAGQLILIHVATRALVNFPFQA